MWNIYIYICLILTILVIYLNVYLFKLFFIRVIIYQLTCENRQVCLLTYETCYRKAIRCVFMFRSSVKTGAAAGGCHQHQHPLAADHRKDAETRRKRGDFIVLSLYRIINNTIVIKVAQVFIVSHPPTEQLRCFLRVIPNPRTAAARESPLRSCCSGCLSFTRSTPPGSCTASSTPNPAMEAEGSNASPLILQPDPDYRSVQAFVFVSYQS